MKQNTGEYIKMKLLYNSIMNKLKEIFTLEHYTDFLVFIGIPAIIFLFFGWKIALTAFVLVQVIIFGLVVIRGKQ